MSEPPPLPSQQSPWPAYIAWTIILACAALLIILTSVAEKKPPTKTSLRPESNVQLAILAKCAVGIRSLSPTTPIAVMVEQTDKLTQTPQEKLEGAILVGELQGAEAAL
ncbi:MAG TPA: hypothetical protein VKK61_05155, partial [Tepidisphaeraceae bacterium]|nr:hypothetical protein [Tepidisphaeraceae bacterium]